MPYVVSLPMLLVNFCVSQHKLMSGTNETCPIYLLSHLIPAKLESTSIQTPFSPVLLANHFPSTNFTVVYCFTYSTFIFLNS